MKNLFLHAKYFAMQEDAEKITMDHIIKAVENMSLSEGQIKEDILKYLNDYIKDKKDEGLPF